MNICDSLPVGNDRQVQQPGHCIIFIERNKDYNEYSRKKKGTSMTQKIAE